MRALLPIIPILLATTAQAAPPQIVTDLPAVHSLVSQVTGDISTPDLLLSGADDPHHAHLRPSQTRAVANADVIIWIGPELTPWLTKTIDSAGQGAFSMPLFDLPDTYQRKFEDGSTDPHAWLDPDNAAYWMQQIAQELGARDPENAEAYAANAAKAVADLATLDTELTNTLAGAKSKNVIMAHDAYGYFAEHYDISIAATIEDGEAANPGAARLSALRSLVETTDIACIFSETINDGAMVNTVLEGTEIPTAELNPTGALMQAGPQLYSNLLTNMAEGVAGCVATKP